jgi:hypothetical protein
MGSLSDLILYKDEKPNIEETDKLAILLHELFKECELIEYERLSARLTDNFLKGEYHTYQIDMDDTVYQRATKEGRLSRFLLGEPPKKEEIEDTKPPIRPERKEDYGVCKVRIPNGTLMRLGRVRPKNEQGQDPGLDIYVEKPWCAPVLEIIKEAEGKVDGK